VFFIVGMLGLYSAKIWALVVEKLISPHSSFNLTLTPFIWTPFILEHADVGKKDNK
jgi:uncharacterized membrane protein YedE/YeeE